MTRQCFVCGRNVENEELDYIRFGKGALVSVHKRCKERLGGGEA